MRIPHLQLSQTALQAIVLEFVTRDGTDQTSVEQRVDQVLRQLEDGSVELHFEQESGTCNILSRSITQLPSYNEIQERFQSPAGLDID